MEIEGEDGEMNIAVYFDEDDNMLGTKVENSTFECIITSELKSFSEPVWTSIVPNAPMLLDLSEDYIYDMNHSSEIVTQYNATYSLTSGSDQKIVIYDDEWDDEYEDEDDFGGGELKKPDMDKLLGKTTSMSEYGAGLSEPPAQEQPPVQQQEEDTSWMADYRVDEDGTEWGQDEEGYWFYREPGGDWEAWNE